MKHFTHSDSAYIIYYNGRSNALDRCIKCQKELDHNDGGQIYAHHKCWDYLSSGDRIKLTGELYPILRRGKIGDPIDFEI